MKCYPIISTNKLVDDSVELEYHVQDNYNLEIYDKWIMIYDVIMNIVYSWESNKYDDTVTVIKDNSKFYYKNKNILTLYFLKVARVSDKVGWVSQSLNTIFDSCIKQ